jgi:hypothetical protein
MVCDGGGIHPQLLDPVNILFDFVGTIQQRILCVDMKMGKCHICSLPEKTVFCPFQYTIKPRRFQD